MRFMLMIHSTMTEWAHPGFRQLPDFQRLSPDEQAKQEQDLCDVVDEITASGELLYAAPLAAPAETRTVRIGGDASLGKTGPPPPAEAAFSGYFVVDCESMERALALAARFPDARYAPVQVRPIME